MEVGQYFKYRSSSGGECIFRITNIKEHIFGAQSPLKEITLQLVMVFRPGWGGDVNASPPAGAILHTLETTLLWNLERGGPHSDWFRLSPLEQLALQI